MGIFEFIYYLGYKAKKSYSLKHQKRLPHKVISIGNITAGGTGKTPATIAIAEEAKKKGFYPVILTRGYKGKAKGPVFVHDAGYKIQDTSNTPLSPPLIRGELKGGIVHRASCIMYGDEPVLMSKILKDVPIVKCVDRYKGGMFALHSPDSPIHRFTDSPILFILDDGFQHWRLFRDKNILLIDAENPFDNRKLLPAGMLREPLKEIERADIIVLTKTENIRLTAIDEIIEELKGYNPKAPVFLSEHKPAGFLKSSGETMPLEWARDKNFFAFCGIGSPESFKKTIWSTGCRLNGMRKYDDHYAYNQKEINAVVKEAEANDAGWIVTTEKDMMRLKGLRLPENFFALKIRFVINDEFYSEAFKW